MSPGSRPIHDDLPDQLPVASRISPTMTITRPSTRKTRPSSLIAQCPRTEAGAWSCPVGLDRTRPQYSDRLLRLGVLELRQGLDHFLGGAGKNELPILHLQVARGNR